MPNRPLKLAIVTDAIYPFHMGGKEKRIKHMAEGLALAGFDVRVFTMNWWAGSRTMAENGVRYTALCRKIPLYVRERRSIVEAVAFALACSRLLFYRFDVIEADHMPHLQMFPIRIITWIRCKPLISTWHEYWGASYWREYLGVAGIGASFVERWAVKMADVVVAVSPGTADRVIRAGVHPSRVTVVANGIDLDELLKSPKAQRGYDVLFVGRLLSHKHVDLLVESCGRFLADGVPITCGIVGEGPELDRIASTIAAFGLQNYVFLLGSLPSATDVYGLLKASKVFVLPSTREGFGIVVIEALASGLPVVTTNHVDNYARMLVEHGRNGMVVEPNVDAFTKAIELLIRSDSRFAPDPLEILQRFDWNKSIGAMGDLIRRCAS